MKNENDDDDDWPGFHQNIGILIEGGIFLKFGRYV
jgi:hypothetical protein